VQASVERIDMQIFKYASALPPLTRAFPAFLIFCSPAFCVVPFGWTFFYFGTILIAMNE